jgi:TPP-dependent pyruvate/acetoin dehydrogenase alpha subunit
VLNDQQDSELREAVKAEVDEATDWAEQQPLPKPEEAMGPVFVKEESNG